ncbi:MAG: hypothetical protein ICV67_07230 [Thermoleophilia bacterium]|nr:hypothetical protein [Thermoleophilia bacterium]
MTEAVTPQPQAADIGGVPWFALMVGMWSAFSTLLIVSPETLSDVWRWLTGLPLALEILMWIAILPWALALAVWQSSWGRVAPAARDRAAGAVLDVDLRAARAKLRATGKPQRNPAFSGG